MSDTEEVQWSGSRPRGGTPPGYVLVNFRISPEDEDGYFVGECIEFGISSFGRSVDEAMANTLEAVEAYLEALEDEGERDRVFAERHVLFYPVEPPEGTVITIRAHPGEYVSPQRLAIAVDA